MSSGQKPNHELHKLEAEIAKDVGPDGQLKAVHKAKPSTGNRHEWSGRGSQPTRVKAHLDGGEPRGSESLKRNGPTSGGEAGLCEAGRAGGLGACSVLHGI